MMVSLKRYVFDFENLVELVMIALVAIILFPTDIDPKQETNDPSSPTDWCDLKRHLAAIALGK
jgi:hypothetical protein